MVIKLLANYRVARFYAF